MLHVAFASFLLLGAVSSDQDTKKSESNAESEGKSTARKALVDDPLLSHSLPSQPRHMIGGAAVLDFGAGTMSGNAGGSATIANIGLQAQYAYTLHRYVQVYGSMGSTYRKEGGTDDATFQMLGGAILNYSTNGDLRKAFFMSTGLGLDYYKRTVLGSVSDASFLWQALFGKRFQITKNISYAPSMGVEVTKSDDTMGVKFLARVIQFDFFIGGRDIDFKI